MLMSRNSLLNSKLIKIPLYMYNNPDIIIIGNKITLYRYNE